jgi:site-specific DNA recombinase
MRRHSQAQGRPNASLAVAYVRVSTDVERQALGKDAQVAAIQEWARQSGVELIACFTEEVSGGASLEKRPVLVRALAEVAVRRAAFLVVQRLDRFSRDPLTAALAESELRRSGATLICADGNGSGDDPTALLVRGILISVANFEKALIRSRIRAALAVKKARGELTGKAPYGFRRGADGTSLVPDIAETAAIEELLRLRAAGLTIRAIRAASFERGLLSRTGRAFTIAAIHRILTRART